MGFKSLILLSLLCFISFPSLVLSQQPYAGRSISACTNTDSSTSVLGYFCNGRSRTCRTYLTFHSQPPYQSVPSISALLGSDPSQLARANSVSQTATFPTGAKVIAPVNCSCSGGYYQANSSYFVRHDDTYFTIANNTYQGLSTCQALQDQNANPSSGFLFSGITITVPLRCACPTWNQTGNGVKYLLGYLVDFGDYVGSISRRFGVDAQTTLDANGLSFQNPTIYPFTTLLIPLRNQPNISQTTAPPSPPPPPPTSSPPSSNSSNHTGVYVGIGVAAGAFILLISLVILCVFCKTKREKASQIIITDDSEPYKDSYEKSPGATEEILLGISDIGHALKVYKFEELQRATENFSAEHRIGGSVYRGVFNGDAAAVKMMNRDVSEEMSILKKINHFNLIGLSGVCFNQGQWYLIYEFAEKGSLSDWLYDRTDDSEVLSWIQRVQIASDVANGLNYLHSYAEPSAYVHKNIKSSNVLLDGNFRAKVANFGVARPAAEGKEGDLVLTRHIIGTIGYMAPEYLNHGLISPQLDVYALGVVMMELITGKAAVVTRRGGDVFLMEAFPAVLGEEDLIEKLKDFVDPLMEGKYPSDLALIMVKLIDGCLKKDVGSRPSMGEIAESLSRILSISSAWVSSHSSSGSQRTAT